MGCLCTLQCSGNSMISKPVLTVPSRSFPVPPKSVQSEFSQGGAHGWTQALCTSMYVSTSYVCVLEAMLLSHVFYSEARLDVQQVYNT